MNVDGKHFRTIWTESDGWSVRIIDQTQLPHRLETVRLTSVAEMAQAIRAMLVRGAPLIGVSAAYGIALAMREDPSDAGLSAARALLLATRPTAVNLRWALDAMTAALRTLPEKERVAAAYRRAAEIADADVEINRAIGRHGLLAIETLARAKKSAGPVNILTHCNAGWLATVDVGTASAPIYAAHDAGIPLHVFVDETRPRNQGASLTAWELAHHGVPHTVIVDNAGGHLMQRGQVDMVIVGADRVSGSGDVCNKIGTYLKALAARDNGIPFYAAVPGPTIDFGISDGLSEIPIEERAADEVTSISGVTRDGRIETVRLTPSRSSAANPAFDVTPARLVTGIITERGIIAPERTALAAAFDHSPAMVAEHGIAE
jgi:methylthioribose-1-phosphate isomerase